MNAAVTMTPDGACVRTYRLHVCDYGAGSSGAADVSEDTDVGAG